MAYTVTVGLNGNVIAYLSCHTDKAALRIGDLHNRNEATLECDQPTGRWTFDSASNEPMKVCLQLYS